MKKLLYSVCALVSLSLAVPAVAARPDAPAEPMKMALTDKPVTFNHDTHARVDCAACHHQVNGEENYQKCSTAGCHDVLGQKEAKSMQSYYRIAHERKTGEINSCLKCHFEVIKELPDQKKALTSCVGSSCHPKA